MPKLYFAAGAVSRPKTCGLIAYLSEADEAEFSRFYTVSNGDWAHRDIHHQLVSLAYEPIEPAWYLLSKRGVVVVISRSGTREEHIPEAGTGPAKYGYVNQIRRVGRTMFVVGYNRQVYRRDPAGWVRADAGMRCEPKQPGVGLLAIDGGNPAELYAAGRHGDLQRFDGVSWHAIASLTTSSLWGISAGPAGVFAVGGEGVVVRGGADQWALLPLASGLSVDSFYDVALFQNQVFLSAYEGLFRVQDGVVLPAAAPLPSDMRCYQLATSTEELWVIGLNRIFAFDGTAWREEICPDAI